VEIRDARADEFDELGDVRLAAYRADGFLSAESAYAATLRALGADGRSVVLVAVGDNGSASVSEASDPGAGSAVYSSAQRESRRRILGTVMLQRGPAPGETVAGPGEAEIRALAVLPEARGTGLGRTLLTGVISRAGAAGVRRLVLLTQPSMAAAQHLYETTGFTRVPERDWSPEAGVNLLAYALDLPGEVTGRQSGKTD
jgi:ribosomal protein S18 acetylase RimI-like enzyme